MIGQILGPYKINAEIAVGGQATLYKAAHTFMGRTVALKVLHPHLVADPDFLQKFTTESNILAQLEHPNIVKVYDANTDGVHYWIAMEWLEGQSVEELLEGQNHLQLDLAISIADQVAAALEYTHSRSLIHRDIKPGNIMLLADGRVKVLDFGIAAIIAAGQKAFTRIGTVEYMSYEQFNGQADRRSDLYSLGATLYEMLTGQLPPKIALHLPIPAGQINADVPRVLESWLNHALAQQPDDRPQTATAFRRGLAEAMKAPLESKTPCPRRNTLLSWLAVQAHGLSIWITMIVLLFIMSGIIFSLSRRTFPALTLTPMPPISTDTPSPFPLNTPSPTLIITSTPDRLFTITDEYSTPMVLVPAGPFHMGVDVDTAVAECEELCFNCNCGREVFLDEGPIHTVTLVDYYIDQYEVTNARYAECVQAGVCDPPYQANSYTRNSYFGNSQYADYPVIYVSWYAAQTYCEWRKARLPTEAEWEKAARGGLDGQNYPWGDSFDGTRANFCDSQCEYAWANRDYDDGYGDTAPTGTYVPNGYGLYDMAGNVWEWVSSKDQGYPYQSGDGREELSGDDARVLRGGSWYGDGNFMRVALRYRYSPSTEGNDLGFRCAADVSP